MDETTVNVTEEFRENILIDYLKVSFDDEMDFVEILIHMLMGPNKSKLKNITQRDYAIRGFTEAIIIGEHIEIFRGGPTRSSGYKTAMLEMKGQACREFERHGDWWKIISYLNSNILYKNVSFKRFDVAFDLFHNDYFTLDDLVDKILKREYKCNSQTREYQIKYDKNNRLLKKQVYVGSIKSTTVINIYDKTLERDARGFDSFEPIWTRIELRIQDTKTNSVIQNYIHYGKDDFNKFAKSLLNETFEIKEATEDSSVSRRPVWEPWGRFVGLIDKIQIRNQAKLESTITKKKDWVDRSVIKTLLLLRLSSMVEGKNIFGEIDRSIYLKAHELEAKDLTVIKNHFNKKGKELSDDDMDELIERLIDELESPF